MDEKSPTPTPDHDQGPSSEGSRSERRRRAQEILSNQRTQLDRLEAELSERLQQLSAEIAHDLAPGTSDHGVSDSPARRQQIEELTAQLQARHTEVAHLTAQLADLRPEIERLQQELRVRETLLRQAHTQQEQRRVEFAAMHEELADVRAQLTAARGRQDEMRRELANERERLFSLQEESKIERRRMARELKAQHAARMAELETRKAELQALADSVPGGGAGSSLGSAESSAELAEARTQVAKLRQLLEQRSDELSAARVQTSGLESDLSELRRQLDSARQRASTHNDDAARQAGAERQLVQLRDERDQLAQKLSAAEAKASAAATSSQHDAEADHELHERLDMAIAELRDLKRANADLESKLKNRGGGDARPAAHGGGGLDWEAQKQRLLASLEADDDDDQETAEERLKIEEVIRLTDLTIAKKDEEIVELRRLLEEQSGSLGSVAVGASAIADILDHDELIKQERQKLQAAAAEWRERIGKAEIDISVERAKIARERAELEEKLRVLQREQEGRPKEGSEHAEPGKLPRGKWLARLGLKDLDDS